MFRFVVIFLAAFLCFALAGVSEECKKLGCPSALGCCKSLPPMKLTDISKIKECIPADKTEMKRNCDVFICVAKKLGHAGEVEGTADMKIVETQIRDNFIDNPEVADVIIEKCVRGDLKEYGTEDMCELAKLTHCLNTHLLVTCTDWRNDGKCEGMEQLVQTCKK